MLVELSRECYAYLQLGKEKRLEIRNVENKLQPVLCRGGQEQTIPLHNLPKIKEGNTRAQVISKLSQGCIRLANSSGELSLTFQPQCNQARGFKPLSIPPQPADAPENREANLENDFVLANNGSIDIPLDIEGRSLSPTNSDEGSFVFVPEEGGAPGESLPPLRNSGPVDSYLPLDPNSPPSTISDKVTLLSLQEEMPYLLPDASLFLDQGGAAQQPVLFQGAAPITLETYLAAQARMLQFFSNSIWKNLKEDQEKLFRSLNEKLQEQHEKSQQNLNKQIKEVVAECLPEEFVKFGDQTRQERRIERTADKKEAKEERRLERLADKKEAKEERRLERRQHRIEDRKDRKLEREQYKMEDKKDRREELEVLKKQLQTEILQLFQLTEKKHKGNIETLHAYITKLNEELSGLKLTFGSNLQQQSNELESRIKLLEESRALCEKKIEHLLETSEKLTQLHELSIANHNELIEMHTLSTDEQKKLLEHLTTLQAQIASLEVLSREQRTQLLQTLEGLQNATKTNQPEMFQKCINIFLSAVFGYFARDVSSLLSLTSTPTAAKGIFLTALTTGPLSKLWSRR